MAKRLCKRIPEKDRRTQFIRIRVNEQIHSEIASEAAIRNLDVSAYMLRMALHRRADVRIETEMILAVRDTVSAIRSLHSGYLERGLLPPEAQLAPVMNHAIQALLNLARY